MHRNLILSQRQGILSILALMLSIFSMRHTVDKRIDKELKKLDTSEPPKLNPNKSKCVVRSHSYFNSKMNSREAKSFSVSNIR